MGHGDNGAQGGRGQGQLGLQVRAEHQRITVRVIRFQLVRSNRESCRLVATGRTSHAELALVLHRRAHIKRQPAQWAQ